MGGENRVERVAEAVWLLMVGRPWVQTSEITKKAYMNIARAACDAYEAATEEGLEKGTTMSKGMIVTLKPWGSDGEVTQYPCSSITARGITFVLKDEWGDEIVIHRDRVDFILPAGGQS